MAISTNSDVFKDPSIFNDIMIPENSNKKLQNITQFLDDELEIKEVNIKQYLDQFKQLQSSRVQ